MYTSACAPLRQPYELETNYPRHERCLRNASILSPTPSLFLSLVGVARPSPGDSLRAARDSAGAAAAMLGGSAQHSRAGCFFVSGGAQGPPEERRRVVGRRLLASAFTREEHLEYGDSCHALAEPSVR